MASTASDMNWEIFAHNLILLRKHHSLFKKSMAKLLHIIIYMLNKIERGELPLKLTVDIFFHVQNNPGLSIKDQFRRKLHDNGIDGLTT